MPESNVANYELKEIIRLADKYEVDVKEIMIIAKVCRMLGEPLEWVVQDYFDGE